MKRILEVCCLTMLYGEDSLRYIPAGRGFDSLWCHWNFSVT